MAIDKTYFFGKLHIAGLEAFESESATRLQELIDTYSDKFIKLAFGDVLTDDQKTLLESYYIDKTKKTSPLANYIYCMYQEIYSSFNTQSGNKELNISNTTVSDWRLKTVMAWNEMTEMLHDIHNKLYEAGIIDDGNVSINYLNDIQMNTPACFESIELANGKIGVWIKGGIFNKKSKYDYNK